MIAAGHHCEQRVHALHPHPPPAKREHPRLTPPTAPTTRDDRSRSRTLDAWQTLKARWLVEAQDAARLAAGEAACGRLGAGAKLELVPREERTEERLVGCSSGGAAQRARGVEEYRSRDVL